MCMFCIDLVALYCVCVFFYLILFLFAALVANKGLIDGCWETKQNRQASVNANR